MTKPRAGFVLCDSCDPDERLEGACVYKGLSYYWDLDTKTPYQNKQVFGRYCDKKQMIYGFRSFGNHKSYPYTSDPSFIQGANREYKWVDLEGAVKFHKKYNYRSFIKIPKRKYTSLIEGDFCECVGEGYGYDMVHDTHSCLIQEAINFVKEWRFFVIEGQVITWGECEPHLTPIHYKRWLETPKDLLLYAQKMASICEMPMTTIDIGLTSDRGYAVIELNSLDLGRVGLYNCDILTLTKRVSEYIFRNPAHDLKPISEHETCTIMFAD